MATQQTIGALDSFTLAYLECALWAEEDRLETELGMVPQISDVAPQCLADIAESCRQFQSANFAELIGANYPLHPSYGPTEMAGHDFYLTRNHHGAGYWDRGLGAIGQRLTDSAHNWGESCPYVGDDKRIYFT